jgi:hypothetical protein
MTMAKFQHVDSTGRLQFWVDDREITVTGEPTEVKDAAAIRFLESCPMVKQVSDKGKGTDS